MKLTAFVAVLAESKCSPIKSAANSKATIRYEDLKT